MSQNDPWRMMGYVLAAGVVLAALVFVRYGEVRRQNDPVQRLLRAQDRGESLAIEGQLLTEALAQLNPAASAQRVSTLLSTTQRLHDLGAIDSQSIDGQWYEWASAALDQQTLEVDLIWRVIGMLEGRGQVAEASLLTASLDQRLDRYRLQSKAFLAELRAYLFTMDQIDAVDQVGAEEQIRDKQRHDALLARWLAMQQAVYWQQYAPADPHFQQMAQDVVGALRTRATFNRLLTELLSLTESELSPWLQDLTTRQRVALSWYLQLRACLQRGLFSERQLARAHFLLSPHASGSFGWIGVPLAWIVLLLLLLARWRRWGPRPIDPMAETLENIEAIDFDTDAITLTQPGLSTEERTTVGATAVDE